MSKSPWMKYRVLPTQAALKRGRAVVLLDTVTLTGLSAAKTSSISIKGRKGCAAVDIVILAKNGILPTKEAPKRGRSVLLF